MLSPSIVQLLGDCWVAVSVTILASWILSSHYKKLLHRGPVVTKTVFISDPTEINTIYGTGPYDGEGVIPYPFVLANREHHTHTKRSATNAHSHNIPKLRGYALTKEAADIAELVQGYATDAVCILTLGRDFNYMDGWDRLGFYKSNRFANDYMAIPMTFLQRLLLNQRQNPKSLADRELMTHAFNSIAPGSDNMGLTEITPDFCRIQRIPVSPAVIKEGRRLRPSVGMILAYVVPEGGATRCRKQPEAGAAVENTPGDHLRATHCSFIPFGQGAHTSSGKWISTMELVKTASTMFYLFDMGMLDDGHGYGYHNLWFTYQKGCAIKPKIEDGVSL
ncbi:cytochrome P450 oxidoreductase [Xylariaceae sp. FL0662B]|nr:cytochrome P450 oxidoreductase [Xylariaceae sp. FL0662B]